MNRVYPWTAFIDPLMNIFPIVFSYLDFFMNGIYIDMKYWYYSFTVCLFFLISSYIHTNVYNMIYISSLPWNNSDSLWLGVFMLSINVFMTMVLWLADLTKV
jgi:hypothetical protein